jgi:hypothetical protein
MEESESEKEKAHCEPWKKARLGFRCSEARNKRAYPDLLAGPCARARKCRRKWKVHRDRCKPRRPEKTARRRAMGSSLEDAGMVNGEGRKVKREVGG